jgi:broad specificity phosphatase PhoE
VPAREVPGIHEVQAGDLEGRNDDAAVHEFHAIYDRWLEGEREVSMPGGESANQVLDRYLPVLTELRTRYLDDDSWTRDIVVVSHGAAIRLTSAILADVPSSFVIEHHLGNTEFVVLTPHGDEGWGCEQWAAQLPPFAPVADPVESTADPMG